MTELAALTAEPHDAPAPRPKDWRTKSRGQGLVEFALITPILILFLALAADFGRAFTAYIAVGSAAREGAAYGAQSATTAVDNSGMIAAAQADAPSIYGIAPSVTILNNGNGTKDAWGYSYVQVKVTYTFTPLAPIPPIPSTITMSRIVQMRVVN